MALGEAKPLKFSQNNPKTNPTGSSEFVVRKVHHLGHAGHGVGSNVGGEIGISPDMESIF